MSEIEDVSGAAAVGRAVGHDLPGRRLDHRPGGHAECGIQVALHGVVGAYPGPRHVEGHAPVHADHIRAGRGHQAEQLARAHSEENGRDAEVGDPFEDRPRGGQHEAAVLVGGEPPGPAVEELDGLDAGLYLGPQEGHRQGGQAIHQPGPEGGVAVHERLHLGEGPGGAALDQVAGDGEGRSGEADQRHTAPGQLAGDEPHGVGDVGKIRGGLEGAQPRQVGRAPERLGHHRSPAGFDIDPEPDGVDRHHDVGEQDGGVHPVAAHRLEGQLGGQGAVADGGEDGAAAPGRPVLGE